METFILVVMEHGSDWPPHLSGAAMGCVVLRQEPDEDQGELLRRAYDRIHLIERAKGTVSVAVLSCNDEASRAALLGRVPLARTLLASVLRTARGRLDLVVRSSARDRAKHSLVALAGTLTQALFGTSSSVSVRFTDGISPSARPRSPRNAEERRSAA